MKASSEAAQPCNGHCRHYSTLQRVRESSTSPPIRTLYSRWKEKESEEEFGGSDSEEDNVEINNEDSESEQSADELEVNGDDEMDEDLRFYIGKNQLTLWINQSPRQNVRVLDRNVIPAIHAPGVKPAGINAQVIHSSNHNFERRIIRRKVLEEIGLSFVRPFMQIRVQIMSLPRELRSSIKKFLPEEEIVAPRERPPTRGRCNFCPRLQDRKTTFICEECYKYVCKEHMKVVCDDCM
ncbi:hypothetical protein J6590_087952 [Homalodisca vitripennis]|nr:hypothetical protein J6590_087952 [Homalodisca vitripennis]